MLFPKTLFSMVTPEVEQHLSTALPDVKQVSRRPMARALLMAARAITEWQSVLSAIGASESTYVPHCCH
jgi:hypothetical protein